MVEFELTISSLKSDDLLVSRVLKSLRLNFPKAIQSFSISTIHILLKNYAFFSTQGSFEMVHHALSLPKSF
ncbi:hypothetical protein TSMEX_011210 [Taenia solium]|eukprot:TsM_000742600 transcript=TsM_000742600 gene=TsM_000742600